MKIVILGRLGVIEADDESARGAGSCRPIAGSLEAIARLNHAGFRVVIACNEPGLALGALDLDALAAIQARLHQQLAKVGGHLDGLFFCPHGPDSGCQCLKPQAGLYLEIGQRFGIDLSNVPIIGDSLVDLLPAVKVGARPLLVLTGKGAAERLAVVAAIPSARIYPDLAAVVDVLVQESDT